jgi:hypothetical protein
MDRIGLVVLGALGYTTSTVDLLPATSRTWDIAGIKEVVVLGISRIVFNP